jgi:hypothetical protein
MLYAPGDNISVNKSEIVDWYIIHKDRPAEGNMIGKYLLLKQDGLAAGTCDPDRYAIIEHEIVT